jgi:hypothetical protein
MQETTWSFLTRLALRHRMSRWELLMALGIKLIPADQPYGPSIDDRQPYRTWDLRLNKVGRQIIAGFVGIAPAHLERALPACVTSGAQRESTTTGTALMYLVGMPSVVGCPKCAMARTGSDHPVHQYLQLSQLLCPRHNVWMLGPHTLNGTRFPIEHADLRKAPEVVQAHDERLRILRRWGGVGHRVVSRASELTEQWRRARLPDEKIWLARSRRIGGTRATLWLALAREAVTYPETVAVARLMLDRNWHSSRRRADGSHVLYDAVAQKLNRPWLADPALYPKAFLDHVPYVRRDPNERSAWPYRSSNEPNAIELTRLGYQPPLPRKRAPRPKLPRAGAPQQKAPRPC